MEGSSRRVALGSIAGTVLGLVFAPLRTDAQYIMSGKEKAGQKKGPRCAIALIDTNFPLLSHFAIVAMGADTMITNPFSQSR